MGRLGLVPFTDRLLSTLSGGERRRGGRALARGLLLLDEPTQPPVATGRVSS